MSEKSWAETKAEMYATQSPYTGAVRSGPQLPQIWNNIYVDTSRISNINRASDTGSGLWTRDATVDQAQAYYNALTPAMRSYFEAVGKQTNSNGRGIYNDYVDRSAELASMGVYKDPLTLFWEDMGPNGSGPIGQQDSMGGSRFYGGGGGGSYSGTSSTTVLSNREDARVFIDSLALRMIGRTVDDREFEDYYNVLLDAERANPTVVTAEGDSVTQQSGLGADGRERVLTEAFRTNEDFADFQVGGRMVDMFNQYLQERGAFDG